MAKKKSSPASVRTLKNGTTLDRKTGRIVKGEPLTPEKARELQKLGIEARKEAKVEAFESGMMKGTRSHTPREAVSKMVATQARKAVEGDTNAFRAVLQELARVEAVDQVALDLPGGRHLHLHGSAVDRLMGLVEQERMARGHELMTLDIVDNESDARPLPAA